MRKRNWRSLAMLIFVVATGMLYFSVHRRPSAKVFVDNAWLVLLLVLVILELPVLFSSWRVRRGPQARSDAPANNNLHLKLFVGAFLLLLAGLTALVAASVLVLRNAPALKNWQTAGILTLGFGSLGLMLALALRRIRLFSAFQVRLLRRFFRRSESSTKKSGAVQNSH